MSGDACEKRACPRVFEENVGKEACWHQRRNPKPCQQKWMAWKMHNRLKDFFRELHPMCCQRLKEVAPAFAIGTQSVLRILQVALQHDGGTIVQRMREWSRRMNPFKAMLLKWER